MTTPILSIPTTSLPKAWTGNARPRLTRRGRLSIAAFLALGLLIVAVAAAAATSSVAPSPAASAASAGTAAGVGDGATVMVHIVAEGDTLWDLASKLEPGADPRPAVDEIRRLNGLTSSQLTVGAALRLPVATNAAHR